jgi:hypothetical protein
MKHFIDLSRLTNTQLYSIKAILESGPVATASKNQPVSLDKRQARLAKVKSFGLDDWINESNLYKLDRETDDIFDFILAKLVHQLNQVEEANRSYAERHSHSTLAVPSFSFIPKDDRNALEVVRDGLREMRGR